MSSLTEAEIKKKFFIKECKIILKPIQCALSKSEIHPVSEEVMSQNKSNINVTSSLRTKRRVFGSHSLKRRRNMRGRWGKMGRGKPQRKVAQLIQDARVDESTSHSENSGCSPLYNEINWEENLDCDTTFMDEFGPRVQSNSGQMSSSANTENVENPISIPPPIPEQPVPTVPQDHNTTEILEFEEGTEIYVRTNSTNDNPEWLAATVVEVDHEEEEVLVKYREGNPPPPMEWMNPTSNRITRYKVISPKPIPRQVTSSEKNMISIKKYPDERMTGKIESDKDAPRMALNREMPSSQSSSDRHLSADSPVKVENSDLDTPDVVRQHKPSIVRARGGWRRNRGALQQRVRFMGISKFVEGEKVLAKWSDHRMQKFPAVIKSILDGGKYDVLFYDGFEKTISEEHLFKTTEEEVAKYEHMNPSEADSYVHMDLDSKEARRQRKKKTFDDYVFARDYKMTKRRTLKSVDHLQVPRKMGLYMKNSLGGEPKEGTSSEVDKPKKMRKRRRATFAPKRDTARLKLQMMGLQRTPDPIPSAASREPDHFYGFDAEPMETKSPVKSEPMDESLLSPPQQTILSPPQQTILSPPQQTISTPIAVKSEVKSEPSVSVVVPEPLIVKREPIEDRWNPSESQDYKPIDINRDGIIRKSLVVPDKNLLPGWSKHAVVSTTNNLWDVILLSPDGYQLTNAEELKEYFEMMPDGGSPPPSLDFLADFNVLAELASKQKEIPSSTMPKIWYRRRGGGGRGGIKRGGRGHMTGGRGRRGVRTLLPKCRFENASPVTTPTSSPSENEFRCPKEGCDKKFRKESLLQMHIKHYHRELSSLVRSVPNMVDLACARSESVNSDWKTSSDLPKPSPSTVKKLLPRSFPNSSPSVVEGSPQRIESIPESHLTPNQGNSRLHERTSSTESSSVKRQQTEERRSTIKTMLPIRPAEHTTKSSIDTDDGESEDDYVEQKKNGSRIFKAGKLKRGGRFLSGLKGDEMGESSASQLPAFKLTKKRKTDKSLPSGENFDVYPDEDKLSSVEVSEDGVLIESLKSEEFINCICGFREEDGLMIQCDICMCWQHGHCSGIEYESDVPDRYVCTICRNPLRVRSSRKYAYAKHYLTQGKLPSFNFRSRNEEEIANKEMIMKRCFELTANVLEIKRVDRSLAAKINIAEKADHPKLYMWAKNWEESDPKNNEKFPREQQEDSNDENQLQKDNPPLGPQPEAPIDLEECRLRLLDHVEHSYSQIEDRLTSLQTQIAALESLDPDLSSSPAPDKITKQTIRMLLKDLETLNKFAAIS